MVPMVDHCVCPNLVTYNTLISGYANIGLASQAFSTFEHMVARQVRISSQFLGYGKEKKSANVIPASSVDIWKIGEMECLQGLLVEVVKLQLPSESDIYNCFLRFFFCRFDRLEETKVLLVEMQTANLNPSEDVYTSIHGF
jgi:pentatricopeptide repeat protein